MRLRETIDGWPSHAIIASAAVVSEDGLVIHEALTGPVDAEAVAALAVTVVRSARQLGAAANGGGMGTVVVELERGPVILSPLDGGHTLVVLATPDRDLGPLLFDVRRHRAALAKVV